MELPEKFAFVDIETTGGNFERDRIIEIGIVQVDNGAVIKTWQSLIDPQQYLPPEISAMTGITTRELESAPSFRQIIDEVELLLTDCIFAAHNARFDYGFLKHEFKRIGKKLTCKQVCTVKLSRRLYPDERHHNLDAIISRFGIKVENRHRALDDAIATWDFFKRASEEKGVQAINQTISEMLHRPATPGRIDPDTLDKLPEEPGVYIFYGESGMPIYVGKSVNIKDRVVGHFSASLHDSKELRLAQEVALIETEVCSGELGALLRETELVKELKPLYNRRLRLNDRVYFIEGRYEGRYKAVDIMEMEAPGEDCLGVFKSKKYAENYIRDKVKEFGLCEKLLHLEKVRKTCFGSEIGRCKACLGIEDPIKYNLRFDMAFAGNKLGEWPFEGPVTIVEKNEGHIFNKWCYLGKQKEYDIAHYSGRFDLDTYKIIHRYIKSPQNYKRIKVINRDSLEEPSFA